MPLRLHDLPETGLRGLELLHRKLRHTQPVGGKRIFRADLQHGFETAGRIRVHAEFPLCATKLEVAVGGRPVTGEALVARSLDGGQRMVERGGCVAPLQAALASSTRPSI